MTLRDWTKSCLVALVLGALYWPGIQHHWETTQDPYFVPFDAVQYVPPFFKFDPKDPIPTTYVKEYYLNAVCPILYKWLTLVGAQFGDVRQFQLGMVFVTYAVFIGLMGRIGWVLGGAALSFALAALTAAAWIFTAEGFFGGAPRMYAYPLISFVLYSLIRDRPYTLVIATVLGGMFYPVVAVIGGACLASWLLLSPLSARGLVRQWALSGRLGIVGLTAFLAISGLTPLILESKSYGRRVTERDIELYPEAGPHGSYRSQDQLPYKLFGNELISYAVGPIYSHGDPFVPSLNIQTNLNEDNKLIAVLVAAFVVLVVNLQGIKVALKNDDDGVMLRVIGFFIVCIVLHIVAWLAAPFLFIPNRYLMLSFPFFVTLLFPWSLYVLLGRVPQLQSFPTRRKIVFLAIFSLYLIFFGSRGNVNLSASYVRKAARPIFDAISTLPKSVTVAGWPGGEIRQVEYITRRNVFLTMDIHQVFYIQYLRIMHQRMDALFDAYFSIDAKPLYRLREKFGVTHLIVRVRDFTDPKQPPEYFDPWRARIAPRLAKIKGREYLLSEKLHKKAAVFNQNGFILVDLAKLP